MFDAIIKRNQIIFNCSLSDRTRKRSMENEWKNNIKCHRATNAQRNHLNIFSLFALLLLYSFMLCFHTHNCIEFIIIIIWDASCILLFCALVKKFTVHYFSFFFLISCNFWEFVLTSVFTSLFSFVFELSISACEVFSETKQAKIHQKSKKKKKKPKKVCCIEIMVKKIFYLKLNACRQQMKWEEEKEKRLNAKFNDYKFFWLDFFFVVVVVLLHLFFVHLTLKEGKI